MKPGKELNALIAEKIFKQKVCDFPIDQKGGECSHYGDNGHYAKDDPAIPDYSTDISEAMKVLEKICNTTEGVKISLGRLNCLIEIYPTRIINNFEIADTEITAYSEEEGFHNRLPHAICKVALMSKGVDLNGD